MFFAKQKMIKALAEQWERFLGYRGTETPIKYGRIVGAD